ncbi:hypothetical protein EXN66_Car002737 [Channa argus]|uniref:Transmembrane protein 109 n=1 Tax=Channa argus TaxID=215402 RepID=A0A6G1P9X8_CHAAH|nr:hypothetical protein EXN66_Car002737 [Channa argus]KAK2919578.1 hypothetical protein Q8A73_003949 [Channa argus]
MIPSSERRAVCGLWLLGALVMCVSGSTLLESGSGMIEELGTVLAHLAGEGRTYLGRLAADQTMLSVQKAFSKVVGVVAEGLASALNVLLQYVSHFLQAAGFQVDSPKNKVTPDGLIFVAQWVLVALAGYWLMSFALRLVASTLRQVLWLLKVLVALACFSIILSDSSVGTQTMAIRLAVLLCVCALLGVGDSGSYNAAVKTAHLEEQVKVMERRLREMERWRKTEE